MRLTKDRVIEELPGKYILTWEEPKACDIYVMSEEFSENNRDELIKRFNFWSNQGFKPWIEFVSGPTRYSMQIIPEG